MLLLCLVTMWSPVQASVRDRLMQMLLHASLQGELVLILNGLVQRCGWQSLTLLSMLMLQSLICLGFLLREDVLLMRLLLLSHLVRLCLSNTMLVLLRWLLID